MIVVRFQTGSDIAVGVQDEAGSVRRLPFASFADLLTLSFDEFGEALLTADRIAQTPVRILPPVDGLTEVWASGVTYLRSRAARAEESRVADVYDLVYDAPRPELFFKSVAWRVVGDGDPIGIRDDSELNVPEPELALVINSRGEIVGATICNDVSSRSIEGVNPLYLPQAKIYAGACSLGPGVAPVQDLELDSLPIAASVVREGTVVWRAQTSTTLMHRRFEELTQYLFRADRFPHGAVLSTGTGIVPDMDFNLRDGDLVTIDITGIGRLANTVRVGKDAFSWIPVPARDHSSPVPDTR
jgi:2-dehydro-3-deoxy-D-arabinonate dehydratase